MKSLSDFERGVAFAATFLRGKGMIGSALARDLVREAEKCPDREGTEARVVEQIADWLDEMEHPMNMLADNVRLGDWRSA